MSGERKLIIPSTEETVGCATEVKQPEVPNLMESMIRDMVRGVKLKSREEVGWGYHGSSKGEQITYTTYFDVHRCEWTTKNRALEGYIINKLSPIIESAIK